MMAQKENKLKDAKKRVSREEFQVLQAVHNKDISEMKMAHLAFPTLSKCIFNIKLIVLGKQKYILATDFSSTLLVCEMLIDNTLNMLCSITRHSDLIQGMMIENSLVYTCSSDKLVMITKFNANIDNISDLASLMRKYNLIT